jgi:hypothetical protein
VRTPSDGYHLYFRIPPGKPSPRNKAGFRPGIDIRGDGGYVVAPGSVIEGIKYRREFGLSAPVVIE